VSRARVGSILAIGVLGYAVFAMLFPRFSTGAQWQVRLSAQESIARARAAAAEYGIDVSGWPAEATVRSNGRLQPELEKQSEADASRAAQIYVAFRDPRDADHVVGVRLDSSGRPTAVIVQREPRPGDDVTVPAAHPIAENAFRRFVPGAAAYRSMAQEDLGDRGVRFRWEHAEPNPLIVDRATVIVAGTAVRDLRYGPELTDEGERQRRHRWVDVVDDVSDISVIVATLFGLVLYLIATGRRLVPQRLGLTLGVICWALLMAELWADLDPKLMAVFDGTNGSARWTLLLGTAFFAIPFGLAMAGGYPSARRRFAAQLVPFEELLLRGRLTSRNVGASLLAGLAAGGWIAAIPHLLRVTGLFGRYRIGDAESDLLFSSGFMPIEIFAGVVPPLAAFALLVSFAEDKLRNRAGRVLGFVLAFIILLDDSVDPLAATLIAGLLVTLLFDFLFRRVSLLALVAGAASSAWAIGAASRLVQPAAAIRHEGWISVILGIAIAAAAFAIALWGSLKPYLPWEPRPARAERERIQAEIEVARLAQERMLPATPPEIPGTSIASYCRPAKQVGGDLYDFVTMSDGSIGITVADVSGKGVPAALVMTITKGLLLAASDGRSDPLQTLADVNAGIHSLGNRSVFVTMLFGVFDPIARTFQFVRAGHTPLLWRKAGGEVTALSPRGIGVGMTSPKNFSALCQRTTITVGAGDFLLLYSDGITEAMNDHSQEFGDDRLLSTVRDRITSDMTAEEARAVVVGAVDEFRGNAPAHDDMTIVVVKT
jgi:hypothetical protein